MRSRRLVELYQHSLPYLMPSNKQPSFADRRQELYEAAGRLQIIAEVVLAEARRMAAAEKRFSERRGEKRERRAR